MPSCLRSRTTCTEPREKIGHNEHTSKSFKEKTVLKPFSPLDRSLDNSAPHTRDLLAHFYNYIYNIYYIWSAVHYHSHLKKTLSIFSWNLMYRTQGGE